MISYNVNPYSVDQAFDKINSKVVSLILKDDRGKIINISNLTSDISLTVPLTKTGNDTPQVEEYSVPEFMMYRVFTENQGNSLAKFSLDLDRPAPFEVYVKYGATPTKQDYDYFTTLDKGTCQNETQSCNVSHHVWFDAERPGKYFIGLVQKSTVRERRSASKIGSPKNNLKLNDAPRERTRRSLPQLDNSDENLCVKFKDPPTPQTVNVTIKMPPYDPKTSVNFTFEVDSVGCLYWSETKEQWTSEGCKVRTISIIIINFVI